jgi:hypothetical protein
MNFLMRNAVSCRRTSIAGISFETIRERHSAPWKPEKYKGLGRFSDSFFAGVVSTAMSAWHGEWIGTVRQTAESLEEILVNRRCPG